MGISKVLFSEFYTVNEKLIWANRRVFKQTKYFFAVDCWLGPVLCVFTNTTCVNKIWWFLLLPLPTSCQMLRSSVWIHFSCHNGSNLKLDGFFMILWPKILTIPLIGSWPNQLFGGGQTGSVNLIWGVKRLFKLFWFQLVEEEVRRVISPHLFFPSQHEPFHNSPRIYWTSQPSSKKLIWARPFYFWCIIPMNSVIGGLNESLWIKLFFGTWICSQRQQSSWASICKSHAQVFHIS